MKARSALERKSLCGRVNGETRRTLSIVKGGWRSSGEREERHEGQRWSGGGFDRSALSGKEVSAKKGDSSVLKKKGKTQGLSLGYRPV